MDAGNGTLFENFIEFITEDTRFHDPNDPTTNSKDNPRGNLVTLEMSQDKHSKMLTVEICENNSILDLGSCVSASGAWAIEQGAMSYTGIERSKHNYEIAVKNLKKYFPPSMWTVHNTSIMEWFFDNQKSYDIVLAAAILYAHEDQIYFLKECAKRTKKYLIIESFDVYPFDTDIPMSMYKPIHLMFSWKLQMVRCSNIPFIDMVLSPLGFKLKTKILYPDSHRFMVVYQL